HAELPPVASLAIGACERAGDADNPIVEERLELGRTESITDSLQPAWVFAVRKPVSQLGEGEAFARRLTFGPIAGVGSGRGVRLSAGPSPRPAPPNRTCVFSRILLSTGACRWVRPRSAPWRSTRGWECDPPGSGNG